MINHYYIYRINHHLVARGYINLQIYMIFHLYLILSCILYHQDISINNRIGNIIE